MGRSSVSSFPTSGDALRGHGVRVRWLAKLSCQLVLVLESQAMIEKIRNTLHQYAHLNRDVSTIPEDADLYACGLTSHATVNLMLGLEDTFQVEFPERMLRRRTFETIANIQESIVELTAGQPAAAP